MRALERFLDGLDFGEAPRWHEGRLWYSDFFQRAICSVSESGESETIFADVGDWPSGLGWMPDGSLLVVSMTQRKVLHERRGELVAHADLSHIATGHCNDMVVDELGNAYIGNFGFDYYGGGAFVRASLALVRESGDVEVVATDLSFPNGSVITPDGATLIVGESFGAGYEAFTINTDATLSDRRRWADVPGSAPDGCTLDSEGAIWFADAIGSRLVRVAEGGEVLETIVTPMPVFACVLGGGDGRTLYAFCAPGSHPDQASGKAEGVIFSVRVDAPRAGRP